MKWISMAVVLVVSVTLGALRAQEQAAAQPPAAPEAKAAVPPGAAPADEAHQKMIDLAKRIGSLERDARKNDATIAAKLQDLEKQRRLIFIQSKPELEALYAEQDANMERARAAWGKAAPEKGKAKQDGEAKAERKAEKQAAKQAEKQAEKAAKP